MSDNVNETTTEQQVRQWLGKNNSIGADIFIKKYLIHGESFEEWLNRVSGGNPEIRKLIYEKKFLFGGRVLANRGIPTSGSLSNCYSHGFIKDDYGDILDAVKNLGMTYKAQGGQGVSLSKLRPKGAPIGKYYTSDGIVPFMKLYNQVTDSTSQGGSRKGALMISLDARHKEALEFITIKSESGIIEKANISLEVDDVFMEAVEKYYQTGEVVVLHETREYSGHVLEYDVVPINVFKALVNNSWDWGDPACLFVNEFRTYNMMEFIDEYEIENCNPCGEQPLAKHAACCLGSLNLAEFVLDPFTKSARIDFYGFMNAVEIAVRGLDDIVEENLGRHPIPEQEIMAKRFRNIGLGIMGYANALMMLGLKYGEFDSVSFTDELMFTMFRAAVNASNKLAKERGAFPGYSERVFDSRIIQQHFSPFEINHLKTHGLRNCSLLSVAPTGSLSTVLGRSGGVEPEYAIKYTRRTIGATDGQDTYYDVYCMTVQDYFDATGEKELPDYFVVSPEIESAKRIKTQATMQKHVDTAISSTINLPKEATKKDVADIYRLAWKSKCKGITMFRDGCKKTGVLTTESPKEKELSLWDIIKGKKETSPSDKPVEPTQCPECGEKTFVYEAGCGTCKNCGYGVCG